MVPPTKPVTLVFDYIVSHTADLHQAKPPSLRHLQKLAVSRANTNGSSHKASQLSVHDLSEQESLVFPYDVPQHKEATLGCTS